MKEQITVTINSGNKLVEYETYAIKTSSGKLYVGYYNQNKKMFKSLNDEYISLKDIIAYANLEELQDKMNSFKKL